MAGDGEVEVGEIAEYFARLSGAPIDDTALASWVEAADADGGGTVDFEEYVKISCKPDALSIVA